MSAFSGRFGKGAMRDRRTVKRTEAEARTLRPGVRLNCGHTSTLDAGEHYGRCGVTA